MPEPERDSARAVAAADAVGQLRVALGVATLVMLALSWPLWVEPSDFPHVPLAPRVPVPSGPVSWFLFSVMMGSLAAATAGIAWRVMLAVSVAVLAILILGDQHRFQAWVYQFGMVALLLAALPAGRALGLVRWWYVATYAYSALSKLDASFCRELGGSFLNVAGRALGLDWSHWPTGARNAAILAMPGWELGVALLLSIPLTRRVGRAAAVVLHSTLLMILGPWGMGHSTIVLAWNAAMAVEVWLGFGPDLRLCKEVHATVPKASWGWLAEVALAIGVLVPLGEGYGYCDAWPAHALYASHGERTDVYLHEDELEVYPPEVRRNVLASGPGPWRWLNLTGWSREIRGVPVYPQARTCNGLAEALAARYGDRRLIRVVQWGRADRWTARRTKTVLLGLEQIRHFGERYWLNAHPAGPSGPAAGSIQGEGKGEPVRNHSPGV
jgi:hypothetical protein